MQLHANEPFCTPPDLRALATRVLTALARIRFARVTSLLAFAQKLGLLPELIDLWHAAGLVHRGLFRNDPIQGTDEPYLALTSRGAKELAAATGLTVEGISSARLKVSSQKRAHDVGVGEVALAVLSLAEQGRIRLLGLETDDRKLVVTATVRDTERGAHNVGLQPDAMVMVQGDRGPVALAIELDRGTTSVNRMRAKYAAYLSWREHKGPERDYSVRALRVVTVVPDARRLDKLRKAALAASQGKPSGFLLFALAQDITVAHPERMFEPIALRLSTGNEAQVPLLDPLPDARDRRGAA